MNKRETEHYSIAQSFHGAKFTRTEFIKRYTCKKNYPDRPHGSIIPSDYCENLNPKNTEFYPKFLHWMGRGCYQFIKGWTPPA